MKVLIKPQVTKPWSQEMYDYNDKVATMMIREIQKSIRKYKNNFDKLNELMVLCGGIKYGDGYTLGELWEDCLNELHNVQNYWLNEEYPYYVKKGLVPPVTLNFIGYDK